MILTDETIKPYVDELAKLEAKMAKAKAKGNFAKPKARASRTRAAKPKARAAKAAPKARAFRHTSRKRLAEPVGGFTIVRSDDQWRELVAMYKADQEGVRCQLFFSSC